MGILACLSMAFFWIPASFWLWLAAAYFFILSLPILVCRLMKFLLSHYQFSARPESFFCYSHIRLMVPLDRSASLVLTLRHFSVAWHRAKPFVTFHMRGLKLHLVQHNVFKNTEAVKCLEDMKDKLLVEIRERGLGSFYAFPASSKDKPVFERLEGVVEEAELQFVSVKSEAEKMELAARCYAEESVFGDINCCIPAVEVKVLCDTEGTIGVLCESPEADFSYRNHKRTTHANKVSLLVSPKRSSASLTLESLDVNMDAREVKGFARLISNYLQASSMCYCASNRLHAVHGAWTQNHEEETSYQQIKHRVRKNYRNYTWSKGCEQ
eukprot:TRINITY_DN14371_c0_g4_i1.p1 TRINITY_DN14371_c0_g4~~TRINITY_DN14371_c0_g4_i1.p1  ORF type:complete len:343 (-),score=28.02 TRINITY_DN14371_c0_g4_i1:404-1378(-)